MTQITLKTIVTLPPHPLPRELAREVFRLAFEEYRLFKPMQYGFSSRPPRFDGSIEYDFILDNLESQRAVMIISSTDDHYLYLHLPRAQGPQYIGKFSWVLPANRAKKPAWREEHQQRVVHLMKLLDSPLAYSGLYEDIKRKETRLVAESYGARMAHTVRDYSEGLAGVYWRNFYGAPFVRLFGERLRALPPESVTWLGEELALVQPYELPTEAGSDSAKERERQFIHVLGPECFYDFERHQKPTRLPELPLPG